MVLKKQLGQTGNKVNFDVCLKVVLSTRRQLLLLLIGLKWGRGGGTQAIPIITSFLQQKRKRRINFKSYMVKYSQVF